MKLLYDPETDSLYIDLRAEPAADSEEVADGVVLDLNGAGDVVGIDIQHASERADLATIETTQLPVVVTG